MVNRLYRHQRKTWSSEPCNFATVRPRGGAVGAHVHDVRDCLLLLSHWSWRLPPKRGSLEEASIPTGSPLSHQSKVCSWRGIQLYSTLSQTQRELVPITLSVVKAARSSANTGLRSGSVPLCRLDEASFSTMVASDAYTPHTSSFGLSVQLRVW